VDVDVRGKERFAGKPVINAPVKRGIDEPAKMVQEALAAADNPNARRVPHFGAEERAEQEAAEKGEHIGQKLKRALLTGVSYMIPFVAGGGLLIALGFLLAGFDIALGTKANDILANNTLFNLPNGNLALYLGTVFFKIGALSMGFLVPALAATLPTPSLTVPASHPASLPVLCPASWAPASSAASWAACWPATSPT
jgi:PTS system fructose-specific IIC component